MNTSVPDPHSPSLTEDATAAAAVDAGAVAHASDADPSLEIVEFELALQFQDMVELGFDGALEKALEAVGGEVLFQFPGGALPDCQRVAAVTAGDATARQVYLVLLSEDGRSMRVEDAGASDNPLAGLAASYVSVMERIAA